MATATRVLGPVERAIVKADQARVATCAECRRIDHLNLKGICGGCFTERLNRLQTRKTGR